MYILGISAFYHESAAAIIKDGILVAAAAEERFTRKKHDSRFPIEAVKFCLEEAGISPSQINYAVFYEKPLIKFERLLTSSLASYPFSYRLFREAMLSALTEKLWVKSVIANKLEISGSKILFVPHHLSHAASSYYCSPFDKAAILTLDGVGEWSVGTYGLASENKLILKKELRFPHSLGLLYSAFTAFLGFEVNDGEYKVMGMAPYGQPRYKEKVYQLLKFYEDGSFKLDLSYFAFHRSPDQNVTDKFYKLFGAPRGGDELFFTKTSGFPSYFGKPPPNFEELANRNQHYADIASSIQKVTEEIILRMAIYLKSQTKQENLCFAGGVALNSVANGTLLRQSGFKNIFVQPAAGDDGGAVGAALYIYHHVLNKKREFSMDHAYWGKNYSIDEIKTFLDHHKIKYRHFKDQNEQAKTLARLLTSGKVVGLYQGRFEWGPRSLGNRSIIADPRQEKMKDIVNTKIKFREPYRPFAPVVLEERAKDFFEIKSTDYQLGKFMLMTAPVKKSKKIVIPAVTHIDGSARVQLLDKNTNPLLRQIIQEFAKTTKVPVLLNTSFNLRGEPIVTTPQNAYNTFINSGLDYLVLENFLISKND